MAFAVAADLMGPMIAKKIIDDHIAGASGGGKINFAPIAKLLAIFFGLAVVTAILKVFPVFIDATGGKPHHTENA